MAAKSDDEFSDSVWPVFTDQDFAAIDKQTDSFFKPGEGSGSSTRQTADRPEKEGNAKAGEGRKLSLYESYRQRGFLTVTDVVSPAW